MSEHLKHRIATTIDLPQDAWPSLNELSGDIHLVAELIGIGNALLLAQIFDGTPIRLYGYKHLVRRWRDQCIRRDYDTNKYTYIDLARKYNLCDRQVSYILGRPDDRQLNLFEASK